MSVHKVVDIVEKEFKTYIFVRSIHCYVKMDMARYSPLKSGPEGHIQ